MSESVHQTTKTPYGPGSIWKSTVKIDPGPNGFWPKDQKGLKGRLSVNLHFIVVHITLSRPFYDFGSTSQKSPKTSA